MEVFQEECESISELTGALDINTVDEMRKILLAHLERNTSIVVDLSSVASCDAAGVQLLLALEKSAESAGKPFIVRAISEGFARDSANLGVTITASTAPSAASHSTTLVGGGIR